MKKRMHKLCTILTASALLAMSVTVYAAEGENTEAGFQPAEEGDCTVCGYRADTGDSFRADRRERSGRKRIRFFHLYKRKKKIKQPEKQK